MSGTRLADLPYKGLMPYEEADALFFFGREADRDVIASNLMAARLTILYGPSGVGKSSVLHAGVAHRVREMAREDRDAAGRPEFAVAVHRAWRNDPLGGVLARVRESVEEATGRSFEPTPPGTPLADALATWAERLDGTLLIVLDQFEEYFLYHPREDGPGTFAGEFPAAVNRGSLRVNFLLSLREDTHAKLDRFEGKLRGLYDNQLRLAPLDRDAAEEAIRGPIERYNELHPADEPVDVEPGLIGVVLDQVKAGAMELASVGRGVVAGAAGPGEHDEMPIETSYLQLVMTRLWEEERRLGSRILRESTFTKGLGGARAIVRGHFDGVMGRLDPAERKVASDVLPYLVTPSGAKIAQESAFIAARSGRRIDEVESVLARLAAQEGRILRKVDSPRHAESYEIFHDVLARVILDYVTVQDAERARARARRQFLIIAGLAYGLVMTGLLATFALWESGKSRVAERDTRAARDRAVAMEKVAREARDRADDNARKAEAGAEAARKQSQLALETLNSVIFDIQRELTNLPGGSPVRRRLLTTTLAQLEKLSGAYVQQSAADRQTAVAMNEMGELILQFGDASGPGAAERPGSSNTQATRSAVGSARRLFARAAEIQRALSESDPADAQARRDLSISYEKLGDALLRMNELAKAADYYRKDVELTEALAKADPADAQARRDLSVSYNRLGNVALRTNELAKAADYYRKGLDLAEALVKDDPADAQARRDLSISNNKLGDVALRMSEAAKAADHYRKGLDLAEALVKADPTDAQARRDLAVSYNKLGDVALDMREPAKAADHYRKGLDLAEALVKADPADAQARRDLSISYNKLGDVAFEMREPAKAGDFYRKGLDLAEALAKADPADAQARRDLSISYERLGKVALEMREPAKAGDYYRKRLDLAEELAKADPADAQAQRDLSTSLYLMGKALEQAGDLGQARRYDERLLAIDSSLSGRSPDDPAARRTVAEDCEQLSGLCARLKDWPAALDYARQTIEHAQAAKQLAAKDGRPFTWNLAISYRDLGDAQDGGGQPKEAIRSYEEGIKVDPKSAALLNRLAWLLATSWDDSVRDGKRAVELARKACELTEWKDTIRLDTLAAACAEAGQFADAVTWQKKALERPEDMPKGEIDEFKARLKLYESGKPMRQAKPEPAAGPAK